MNGSFWQHFRRNYSSEQSFGVNFWLSFANNCLNCVHNLPQNMSKKKGLSFEEKRTRMLELFHEKKEPFLLKELEKLGPKLKGVVMQSVKEIVQSLVADDLVETDKIGSSTYFWSFPSKALNSKLQRIEDLKAKIADTKQKTLIIDAELKKVEAQSVYKMRDSALYKEDWLGLKELDTSGRLREYEVIGDHLQIDMNWFDNEIIDKYLK
ncbi:unnamed protein product [Medioppia subpectinata]|uniref:Mnd1 HTH domain-containing protein n=1 Tax=Medioppia subpectinata TaxID=1979941 RepID=A0A7R9L244_9ACAR|nr:unnamed protein product [Medioppia subpectinata]CAG2113867.1 unnamed protein product [Medioppia subpectinata]